MTNLFRYPGSPIA